jgi:type III secretion protein U
MSEKTEEPSDHKLKQARDKGQVAKSQDVAIAASMLGVVATLVVLGEHNMARLRRVVQVALEFGDGAVPLEELYRQCAVMLAEALWIIGPPLFIAPLFAAIGLLTHVGLQLSFEAVTPKPENVDPAAGVKKLFSVKSLITFGMMLAKAIVIGFALWNMVLGLIPMLAGAAYQTADGVGTIGWQALLKLMAVGTLLFLIFGPVDFVLQRWLFRRDQKMSKDDQKKEYKEQEGDPMVKGQRKQMAYEMANEDPKAAVATANAVVVNPTHYAVAIRYLAGQDSLPVVVAKGLDEQALSIRRHAESIGVPVFANPPLARALHKVPLDGQVPEALFEAVAAILRWVEEIGRRPAPAPSPH